MRAAFPRALSILLLAFIICGTTVEAAHNHGNLTGSNKATGAAHFSDPARDGSVDTGSLNCNDCLICQLHQNLSNTYFTHEPAVAQTESNSVASSTTVNFKRDDFSSGLRGRAPPVIL